MTPSDNEFATTRRQSSVPVLETEQLTLRVPHHGDVAALAMLANDRRIAECTTRIPYPFGVADAEQFIDSANRCDGEICFAITLDDSFIGICSIDPREGGPEIGYWLGLPFWGRGFATEAVRAAIDFAFGELNFTLLQSGARVSNPASRRVLEKCGFQWTGVRLSRIRAINSAAPIDRFRLDRGLWDSLRSWGRASRVA
jgi:RimJ/RimL family protein N-acetyltransferase